LRSGSNRPTTPTLRTTSKASSHVHRLRPGLPPRTGPAFTSRTRRHSGSNSFTLTAIVREYRRQFLPIDRELADSSVVSFIQNALKYIHASM
jgi:hypothetical protein